jgi:hypothetical protein
MRSTIEEDKSSATGYVTRDAVRQGANILTVYILLQLGLLCVTLFNLDTLCLTYSDKSALRLA